MAAALLLASLLSGCRPEEVIAPEEMVAIFADFYRTDATVEVINSSTHGSFRVDSTRMYLPLITKRGYTKDQFMSSLTYYMHRPDDFDDIFKQVSAKLDREMDLAESAANQEYLDMEDRGIEEVEEAPVVEEGKEPHIEKEERQKSLAADTVASEKPAAPEKPVKKERQSKRKKISQKDLKRLEEELK
ncbi:MAG: DUF4296 domain-containing protein [Bacteroidales bacterium]|nr:DUF4296 domain-containing protein [Bacteroidales bacterium]MBQ5517509.1 DUF4296 domain-containing protein [Bacteroidales bacterium]